MVRLDLVYLRKSNHPKSHSIGIKQRNKDKRMKSEKFTKRERLLLGMVIICLLLNIITLLTE